MPSWRSVSWRTLYRRLLAVGALFAYLAATNGFPLPPPVVIKDGGKPFPCQGHACGCQTAEECWRHCCCFTPEERWAWAEENHVQPPDYAERPNPKRVEDSGLARATDLSAVLSLSKTADTAVPQADSCTATEADHDDCCPCCKGDRACSPWRTMPSTPPRGRSVSPLRCQGLTTQWVTTGVVPSEPLTLAPRPEPAPTGRLFPANFSAQRIAPPPPFHPPRFPFFA